VKVIIYLTEIRYKSLKWIYVAHGAV